MVGSRFAVTAAAASLLAFSPALAAIPSPITSTLPACMTICPDGDLSFDVVVRDFADIVIANSLVTIELSTCPDLRICPQCGDDYVYDIPTNTIRKFTDAAGHVSFSICGGGACAAGAMVRADGVPLGQRPLASTDQNGDFVVDGADAALVASKVGTTDLSADFDCDGDVDVDDQAIEQAHVGHLCVDPTPVRSSTWGVLKTIYR
jgi:hypothetical protein